MPLLRVQIVVEHTRKSFFEFLRAHKWNPEGRLHPSGLM